MFKSVSQIRHRDQQNVFGFESDLKQIYTFFANNILMKCC